MDWVIKFLVGVSQVKMWVRLFAFSAKKTFRCDNQGLPQLLQHASSQSHKTLVNEILAGQQMVLAPNSSAEPVSNLA